MRWGNPAALILYDLSNVLTASITRTDKNGDLDVDDAAALHVEAANKSENPAIFKMYFCDVREIKKGADLSTYLNKPALSCKVQGLGKDCTLDVDVAGPDKKKTKSVMEFLKEVEKDEKSGSETVVSRYAKLTIPAGSSVDFDFSITSSKECAVTVIPVMAQETAVYGDAQSAEWEEKVTFFDHIVNFFTGKQPEKDDKDDEDIQISDVQGISADVPEGLNEDDFASKRLMVLADDPSVFVGKNNVIGQYGDLYLMQFDTAEAAMQAYGYYKDIVTAVEPDISVEVASAVNGADADTENDVTLSNEQESDVDTENDADVDIVPSETEDANPEDNPINALNTVDASDVKKERGVIALIDTGVGEHANVIDRISVIDDNASGNGGSHGDAMVNAIVSQDPDAKILSIKAMDDNGYGTVSALVAAMEYAIEQKVSVINLSLYARTTLSTSVLKSEIEKAVDAGIIVVGAAGNDGADVKDYVPGSVECAYIIGACNENGYRQVLSNYGDTVDYNVTASSTSEASALFAGFVSANGIDAVKGVLNQGLIYETGYGDGEDVVVKPSDTEDFSKYDVDESKTVVTRYTFADASKIENSDTLDSIYCEKDYWDILYGTLISTSEVYAVGDGTYKIRLDAPMLNGLVTGDYLDVTFAAGNDGGHKITEGVSFDKHTGIATVTEEAFLNAESDEEYSDFSDLQIQVMASVNGAPERIMQDVTVVNYDGTRYSISVPMYALQVENIPLAVEGLDEELKSEDFEMYINGEQTPCHGVVWDEEKHLLLLSGYPAALIHSVKIVVKKDVDSIFKTAFVGSDILNHGPDGSYDGGPIVFYLPEGTDVSRIAGGTSANSRIGGEGYPSMPEGASIGSFQIYTSGTDYADEHLGQIGIPKNLFGVDFTFCTPDGSPMGDWCGYNPPIDSYCQHVNLPNGSRNISPEQLVYYKIINTVVSGDLTVFTMAVMSENPISGTGNPNLTQAVGGVIRFAVPKDDMPEDKLINLKVVKEWDENGDTSARPANIRVRLYESTKRRGTSSWVGSHSSWSNWHEIKSKQLNRDNDWTHTWNNMPRIKVDGMSGDTVNDTRYKYKVEEDTVSGYKTTYKQFAFSNVGAGGTTTATITNELDPLRVNLRAKKKWKDSDNALKARPSSIKLTLQVSHKYPGDDGWSDWEDKKIRTLSESNKWTVKWTNQIRKKGRKLWRYRVVEKDVPDNYKVDYSLNNGWYDFTDVEDGDTLTITATNTLVPGHLKLHKDSELPYMTDGNKCYSLKDAQYEVYTDSACTTKATYIGGPLKTDTKGDTDVITLLPGTYWVKEKGTGEKVGGKEKSHAKGFFVDTTAHKVTVTKNHTEDEPLVLKVEEPAMNDPLMISIQKIQKGPSNGNLPSLENAEFTVKYYDGFYDKSNVRSQTPTRVWVIKTKRVGSSNMYRTRLEDDYLAAGSDELYKDDDGFPVVPLGTITVQETKPAPGYVLDGNGEFINLETGDIIMRDNEMYVAQIKDATSGVFLSGGNEYTMENSTTLIHCRIEKLDGDGKKVAGVTYKIEYQQARDVYKKTTTVGSKTVTMLCDSTDDGAVLVARNTKNVYDKYGNLVGEQTTDAEGKAAFEDLYPDDYAITEIKTVNGLQLLKEPIKVSLPMRMTKAEADEWNLDTSDTTKVQWSDSENCFIVLDATFKVTNHATFAMPMSGGTVNGWTFIPLVLGMGVFAGVAIVLFRKKKRAVKAE